MNGNHNKQLDIAESIESVFEEYDEYNSYYESISVVCRMISFVLFVCLLLFVISSAFMGAEEFSYDNLEYITRNFALKLEENRDATRQPIRYNPDTKNQISLFGEGLAVCGSSWISLYSVTGRQTCSETITYRTPVMISSDKYVLVYDEGNCGYTVYNSFSSVHNDVLDNQICGAELADNGCYALLLSNGEYNSVVEVYNSDFALINRYNKNAYVSCVDITENEVLIVASDAQLGSSEFSIEILVSVLGEEKAKFNVNSTAGFPLGCKITPYGYVVVCTDSVLLFSEAGANVGKYVFGQDNLADFVISDTNTLLLFKKRSFDIEYELICIEKDGSVLYNNTIHETIFDIELNDSRALLLTETNILCLDENFSNSVNIESSDYNCRILAIDEDAFYYCSNTGASAFTIVLD